MNSDEESDSDAYQDIPEQVDDTQTRLQDALEDENSDEESDAVDEDVKPTAEQEPVMNPADEDVIEEGRLFFRNLPYSCTEEELREFAGRYGEIVDVFIPLNPKRESKGYGFVTFMCPEQAIAAIEVDFVVTFHVEAGRKRVSGPCAAGECRECEEGGV